MTDTRPDPAGLHKDAPATLSETRRLRDSLVLRLALLLSLALLPIGALSVLQTNRAVDTVEQDLRDTLLGQLAGYAQPERDAIGAGFGLARGLAATISLLDPDAADCTQLMQRAQDENPEYLFIGHIDEGARSSCNTTGEAVDFPESLLSAPYYVDPQPDVTFSPSGHVTGKAVVIVSEPVYAPDGAFRGFVSLSIAPQSLSNLRRNFQATDDLFFLTFDTDGIILSSDAPREGISARLPEGLSLERLTRAEPVTFAGRGEDGRDRIYAVSPIVPGRAYALAGWSEDGLESHLPTRNAFVFPLLMWAASVAVALLTIQRFMAAPIGTLRRRMRGFADSRRFTPSAELASYPTELRDIGETFENMAAQILREEAEQENRLRERGVLLKEVHHRVKNNLQLMSSILNMQIRRSRSDEARGILRDIQRRLMSLSTVHRVLYEEETLARVRADDLLGGLVRQLSAIAESDSQLSVETRMADLDLVPDQAAPLAMLVTEAFTNALKYARADSEGRTYVEVTLEKPEPGLARCSVANSIAAPVDGDDPVGLGKQLIDAFVAQLSGTLESTVTAQRYEVSVTFRIVPAQHPEPGAGGAGTAGGRFAP